MIKNNTPLSMVEVIEYIKKDKENNAELVGFMKRFLEIDLKKAKELKKEIEKLELMKVKEESIIKIIDLMPNSAEDLNKIFVDVSLDEDETKKILDTIKKVR
jgi:DNA-directed RNA polymerase subunit F